MNTILKWGILLGLAVELWTYVLGFAGWYRDPVLQSLFWAVIVFQIIILFFALRQTAAQGRTYGSQVGAGALISLTAGVVIFVGSYLFTTVVFPDYFAEVRAAGEGFYRSQGMSEAEIATTLDAVAGMQTPFMNALLGTLGTFVTGVVASLILAIGIRKKATS